MFRDTSQAVKISEFAWAGRVRAAARGYTTFGDRVRTAVQHETGQLEGRRDSTTTNTTNANNIDKPTYRLVLKPTKNKNNKQQHQQTDIKATALMKNSSNNSSSNSSNSNNSNNNNRNHKLSPSHSPCTRLTAQSTSAPATRPTDPRLRISLPSPPAIPCIEVQASQACAGGGSGVYLSFA